MRVLLQESIASLLAVAIPTVILCGQDCSFFVVPRSADCSTSSWKGQSSGSNEVRIDSGRLVIRLAWSTGVRYSQCRS